MFILSSLFILSKYIKSNFNIKMSLLKLFIINFIDNYYYRHIAHASLVMVVYNMSKHNSKS